MKTVAAALLLLSLSTTALAQTQGEYRVPRAAVAPKIDGILDDAAWAQLAAMPTGQW